MRVFLIQGSEFLVKGPISREYKELGRLKRKKKFLGNSVIDLPPMGLLYMAATLIKGGHEVAVLDTPTLQLNISETLEEINRFKPDLVGVSIYSGFRNNMYVLTQELRKVFDGPILAGGPHCTAMRELVMEEFKDVDFLLSGEAETTALELLSQLEGDQDFDQVTSLSYRKNGSVVHSGIPYLNEVDVLNKAPLPARHLLKDSYDAGFYFSVLSSAKKTDCLVSSRGCTSKCTFCYQEDVERSARFRSVDNVVEEIEQLAAQGVTNLEVMDDNFILNKKRCHAILDRLIEKKIKMSYRVRSRVTSADYELWAKLKKAGVYAISFGMEAGSQKMLNIMRKGTTIEQNARAAKITKESGMLCFTSWNFGMPGETPETIKESGEHIMNEVRPTTVAFYVSQPLPMTPLYEEVKANGTCMGDWSAKHNKMPYIKLDWIENLDDISNVVKKLEKEVKTKPWFIMGIMKQLLHSPNKHILRHGWRYLKGYQFNRIFMQGSMAAQQGRDDGNSTGDKVDADMETSPGWRSDFI